MPAAYLAAGEIAEAKNLRMRTAPVLDHLQGPFIKPPGMDAWEVPLNFLGSAASRRARHSSRMPWHRPPTATLPSRPAESRSARSCRRRCS